ncbi:MAG: hypothetical protein IBX71_05225 [Candidatus Desulforudis sp.]|nr:hypothetical protein [Desulforudis sp.]
MAFWHILDQVLIVFYRITGSPAFDFLLGTFLVALLTVVIGEFTISIAYLVNRKHLQKLNARMVEMNNASVAALKSREKAEYKAKNKEANDAFGRVFFNAIALSAACLWPVFFALAWMQLRFVDVRLPVTFTGLEANYVVVFLVAYILARILFGTLRPRLPYFRKVQQLLDEQAKTARNLDRFVDPVPKKSEG